MNVYCTRVPSFVMIESSGAELRDTLKLYNVQGYSLQITHPSSVSVFDTSQIEMTVVKFGTITLQTMTDTCQMIEQISLRRLLDILSNKTLVSAITHLLFNVKFWHGL